jgi:choline kinase
MVETLFAAREFIKGDEDLIIGYGDIVYNEMNLVTLLESNEEISIMVDVKWKDLWSLRMDDPLTDVETLKLKDGLITELGKKPNSYNEIEGQYTGLIKVRGDKVADFIGFYDKLDRDKGYDGNNFDNMYMTSFIQLLIDSGWKVAAAIVKNGWLEVDTVEDLEMYEKLLSTLKMNSDYILH